jgi:hypothetical protein
METEVKKNNSLLGRGGSDLNKAGFLGSAVVI